MAVEKAEIQRGLETGGLKLGRVGYTRFEGSGGQFRRRDGERLDARRPKVQAAGGQNIRFDQQGVAIAPQLNLEQAPIVILNLPTPHPFRVYPVLGADNQVYVYPGFVKTVDGRDAIDDYVYENYKITQQGPFTVTELGYIELDIVLNMKCNNSTTTGTERVNAYVSLNVSSATMSFKDDASKTVVSDDSFAWRDTVTQDAGSGPTEPTAGTHGVVIYIAKVQPQANGRVEILEQYVQDDIWLPRLTEVQIQVSAT